MMKPFAVGVVGAFTAPWLPLSRSPTALAGAAAASSPATTPRVAAERFSVMLNIVDSLPCQLLVGGYDPALTAQVGHMRLPASEGRGPVRPEAPRALRTRVQGRSSARGSGEHL